jgi:hypothetical protein
MHEIYLTYKILDDAFVQTISCAQHRMNSQILLMLLSILTHSPIDTIDLTMVLIIFDVP